MADGEFTFTPHSGGNSDMVLYQSIQRSSTPLVVVVGQFRNATPLVGLSIVVHAGQAYSKVVGDCFRIVTMSRHQHAGNLCPVGFKLLTVLKPTKGFEFFYG